MKTGSQQLVLWKVNVCGMSAIELLMLSVILSLDMKS